MNQSEDQPFIPASKSLPELTLKVFILSIILAVILAASNAYLALKIGTTISASIPASVLAITVLRFFKNSNVLESNIIQTAASAGEGVACAVAFTIPAMIILHIWQDFPYWETVFITALGGTLGVLFSVPLRRVLLNLPALHFPEGTAIGNVLKASAKQNAQIRYLAEGGLVGAIIACAQDGLKVLSGQMNLWTKLGPTIFGLDLGFAPAPLAAGFIVGFEAGSSILIGLVIGWLVILPLLAMNDAHVALQHESIFHYAMSLWSLKIRFVGVGVMLVGGVWTLIRLIKPVLDSIRISIRSITQANDSNNKTLRTEHDISIKIVLGGTVVMAVLLFGLLMYVMNSMGLLVSEGHMLTIAIVTIVYLLIVGFLMATICGYFTGLIGSTNNPLSGILILALLVIGIIFVVLVPHSTTEQEGKIAGIMILITTITASIAVISNENLQDLKAGQMVGATPWKQQFILIVGVIASALVVAPVFQMLFQAYGIGGVFPRTGMNPSDMLAAPQAGLMAAIAHAIRSFDLPWQMIYIGAGFAVVCIIADMILQSRQLRVVTLAVGLGVYLPPEVTTPIIFGSLINFAVRFKMSRCHDKSILKALTSKHEGAILLACGLVAGAAIMGVLLAIPFVIMGSADALSVVPAYFAPIASFLGLVSLCVLLYWIWKTATR